MKRALITGIAGFVGSHLAEYLLAETDWRIFGLMRWNEILDNLSELMPEINSGKRVTLVEGDLTDAFSITRVVEEIKPDYVFHLAAQSYVQASFGSPIWTLETNVIGTAHLLEALRTTAPEAMVHNCSSSEVYGRVSSSLLSIDENFPLAPVSPYAVSKAAADLLGCYYAKVYGLKVLTTRMFTHTGPRRGDVFAESSFAKQIAMIEEGQLEPPVKVGNLDSVRTVADVRDAVRAYHMLLTVDPQPGEVYNIGGTSTRTVNGILEALFEVAGRHYEVAVDPARLRPLDVDNQVPNCSKFIRHTDWVPQISFEKTITDLLAYWRDRVKRGTLLQR